MSLPNMRQQRTFFDTDQVLSPLVATAPKGAERFVFFAERIWPELLKLRPQLEAMYCMDNGRPAEEPVRMTGVTILQFMERLPDRQAAEACTWDGRWKLALHMEVDEHPVVILLWINIGEGLGEEDIWVDVSEINLPALQDQSGFREVHVVDGALAPHRAPLCCGEFCG